MSKRRRLGSIDTERIEDCADGKVVKDDQGISCKIKVSSYQAIYPYKHTVRRVECIPTAAGKRTKAYKKIREQLRDDWVTDLKSSDPEVWAKYMRKAGCG